MRVVDADGKEVKPGDEGELTVKSPATTIGYWNNPEETAESLRDGWLYTGDLVKKDAEGYYWFVGRKKELIVRGGSNISPQEVEAVLYQHPAVAEAGVIGTPDETWGEVVVAYVARKEGVQNLGQVTPRTNFWVRAAEPCLQYGTHTPTTPWTIKAGNGDHD